MTHSQDNSYEVAVGAHAVYIRVHGLASMNNCLSVRDFIEDMFNEEHSMLVVDLADCTGMDSTFMGLLAAAAQYERDHQQLRVAVINASDDILRLMMNVGITELVFVESARHEPPHLKFVRLQEQPDETKRLTLIKWAHEHLIDISAENEREFGPFLQVLKAEMKRSGMA